MSKMGSHDPFEYFKHKVWPKKGLKVKVPIWLSTTKSQESTWNMCMKVRCHKFLESSRWGLQFCFRPQPQSKVYTRNYGPPKCREFQFWEFQDSQLGSFGTKWHLDVAPMVNHNKYYKRKGDGFPQVWVMVSLMNLCMHMVRPCTKSVPTMH
jgi:hypothetical protein